jgi:hypothetical protein
MWGPFDGAGESVSRRRSADYRRGFTFKLKTFGVMFNEPPLRDRVKIANPSTRVPATTHQRNASSPWAGWSGLFVR